MKRYIVYRNCVKIILNNGKEEYFFFTEDSGKVFYRYKIETISNVKHPGIFLGVDKHDERWYMHNHYENGRPTLEAEVNFSKKQPVYRSTERYSNDSHQTIVRGLEEILKGKPYSPLGYNCQTFVNVVCSNESRSEDVEKWIGRVTVSLLIFGIIRSL